MRPSGRGRGSWGASCCPVWFPLLGVAVYASMVYLNEVWSAPATFYAPVVTKFLGKLTFLTIITLYLTLIYFVFLLVASVTGHRRLNVLALQAFPVFFALNMFVTIAYYALDHFDARSMARKELAMTEGFDGIIYENIFLASHVVHMPGGVMALLMARHMHRVGNATAPVWTTTTYVTLAGVFAYIMQIHVLHLLTGAWIYPVLEHVSHALGIVGVIALEAALSVTVLGFAYCGLLLFNYWKPHKCRTE
eukprot:CAMPEP_0119129586 /NCGR_PEP_ID=MMETSP1310-20130426/7270_1 /TAXON_ID=464262 /ORGANISM="Genus nov. species nov., Strain RCC2339" /LENGTH=248 /DNA_ID=CAMNT_0007120017 /DNA_START=105 /DNA_END=851 /DNA_ORIENTATION=+